MNFRKKSAAIRLLTGSLTLSMVLGAVFIGVYPTAAASGAQTAAPAETGKGYASEAARYYEADSLPLFEITFPRLDEAAQKEWLAKLYAQGDFAFFSAAVRGLDPGSSLFSALAEKAYDDEEIAFFSILADCMDEAEIERWRNRALTDGRWAFQSMLFDRLDKSDGFEKPEEAKKTEWEAAQAEAYKAAGVTMDSENYYYRGQLVNIFLDTRVGGSFYTLHTNPAGTVNIQILRDAEDNITSAACLSEAEAAALLLDMA